MIPHHLNHFLLGSFGEAYRRNPYLDKWSRWRHICGIVAPTHETRWVRCWGHTQCDKVWRHWFVLRARPRNPFSTQWKWKSYRMWVSLKFSYRMVSLWNNVNSNVFLLGKLMSLAKLYYFFWSFFVEKCCPNIEDIHLYIYNNT